MEVLIWIIIIVVAVLIIRLLRRWIKRLIFIAILLVLAFFIYWIFSPSWAGKLWYNVRTFPQRIASRVSDQNFMDYENYKLNLSEELNNIIPESTKEENDENSNEEAKNTDDEGELENDNNSKNDELDVKESNNLSGRPIIKSFPTFTKLPDIKNLVKDSQPQSNETLSWFSKSDVLWIINWYIEKNLDDDTDILVTVEYEEDYNDPQKITLETQPRPANAN